MCDRPGAEDLVRMREGKDRTVHAPRDAAVTCICTPCRAGHVIERRRAASLGKPAKRMYRSRSTCYEIDDAHYNGDREALSHTSPGLDSPQGHPLSFNCPI